MNIFFLDRDPVQAARYLHDVHCRSQINESTQLLSGWASRYIGPLCEEELISGKELSELSPDNDEFNAPGPWVGEQNPRHPCAVWLDQGLGNVKWLVDHLREIIKQYDWRHKNKDLNKYKNARRAVEELTPWLELFMLRNFTAPAQAYGPRRDEYYVGPSTEEAVIGYRRYYVEEKFPGATWTEPATKPDWVPYEPPKPKVKISAKGLKLGKSTQVPEEIQPTKVGIGNLKIKRK